MSEHATAVRRIMETGDHLSPMDRAIVGNAGMQLRFEIRDQLDARRIAEILRIFANRLEILSQPKAYKEREALLLMRFERSTTQARLASKPHAR